MHIMIDGYNLLRYITKGPATAHDREQLIARLNRYARYTGNAITIVFDGGDALRPYKESYKNITIWYSGTDTTADDVIIAQLPHYPSDGIVLVSDDRKLNEEAQKVAIVSVSPAVFYSYMQEKEDDTQMKTHSNESTIVKITTHSIPELDQLMMESSGHIKNEESLHRPIQQKKSSKIERRLERILRKL